MRQVFQLKNKPHGINRGKLFLDEGFVCIGWPRIDNLENAEREEIRARLEEEYGYSGQQLGAYTGAVDRFVNVIQEGDVVLVPEVSIVHVGIVGPYYYDERYDNEQGMCHRRKISWRATIAKSSLNQKMLDFVKNRGVITKFSGEFEETGLEVILSDDVAFDPFTVLDKSEYARLQENLFNQDTVLLAKDVLVKALRSEDLDLRFKAATEILRLSRN